MQLLQEAVQGVRMAIRNMAKKGCQGWKTDAILSSAGEGCCVLTCLGGISSDRLISTTPRVTLHSTAAFQGSCNRLGPPAAGVSSHGFMFAEGLCLLADARHRLCCHVWSTPIPHMQHTAAKEPGAFAYILQRHIVLATAGGLQALYQSCWIAAGKQKWVDVFTVHPSSLHTAFMHMLVSRADGSLHPNILSDNIRELVSLVTLVANWAAGVHRQYASLRMTSICLFTTLLALLSGTCLPRDMSSCVRLESAPACWRLSSPYMLLVH